MSIPTSDDMDVEDYVARATRTALAGVASGIADQGGHLVASESWEDERGHWLRVRLTLEDLPAAEVHDARILRPRQGPATMMLPADVHLAADTARFGFVVTRRGIVPDRASSWVPAVATGRRRGRADPLDLVRHERRHDGQRPCLDVYRAPRDILARERRPREHG